MNLLQVSILIVSRNRKKELEYTLNVLWRIINISTAEVLVFLDGHGDNSMDLLEDFPWVKWFFVDKSIGASAARNQLYSNAKGAVLIGLDDDSHPVYTDFITRTIAVFDRYPNVGIIAFEEIKGIFKSDEEALRNVNSESIEYLTREFIGCGFAIRKDVYNKTNGFPVWMDIYGEESCLSIEVLAKKYDILFSNSIRVNHRVDIESRKKVGRNYYRFGQQLKNTTFYYLVYHPVPILKIATLYWHNFKKYALVDGKCFMVFFSVVFNVLKALPFIIKYRKPIDKEVFKKASLLKSLQF